MSIVIKSFHRMTEYIFMLIYRRIKIDRKSGNFKYTALHIATKYLLFNNIQILVDYGAGKISIFMVVMIALLNLRL